MPVFAPLIVLPSTCTSVPPVVYHSTDSIADGVSLMRLLLIVPEASKNTMPGPVVTSLTTFPVTN